MNLHENMIIDTKDGKIITSDILSCIYNSHTKKYDITFKNGKLFSYSSARIQWLKHPKVYDGSLYQISHKGRKFSNIDFFYVFQNNQKKYCRICFDNQKEADYPTTELQITQNCLTDAESRNVLEYLRHTAAISNLKGDDGTGLLSKQYEKLTFVERNTALACYLHPDQSKLKTYPESTPIFPFGCNASQYRAVKAALENQISVIKGPPGTGKTQTILNIIANLLLDGKTMQIVSNNNSAVENILEKLADSRYQMDFIAAHLGSSENKSVFLKNQTGTYPDLSKWNISILDQEEFKKKMRSCAGELKEIYANQERLALAKLKMQELTVEKQHFDQYLTETGSGNASCPTRRHLTAKLLMQLWQECQNFSDRGKSPSFFFKLKSCFLYGISSWNFYKQDISKIINLMQGLFYDAEIQELHEEIHSLESQLKNQDTEMISKEYADLSMKRLKNALYKKYSKNKSRPVFTDEDFWKNYSAVQKEYPVVLSTTFSSRSSICKDARFDYLIMDEASQVDIVTGALALSCAKNAVIVGDEKQLPNVVTDSDAKRADSIFESYQINPAYRFSEKSFLQSVCALFPSAPQTLLREHYRCHPKIINFCNQKFYNGELVVMSEDHGEKDVLSVVRTAAGNHQRGHINQRQIDCIRQEILPAMHYDSENIGIIAPYNDQVHALQSELGENNLDIATVHKFQGREKDAIILTTVDNVISDFADDPYLLNVAISRAKKKLCLVISGNEQPEDSNLQDLISYIEYNNCTIAESKIYSVFDYLYSQYTESRLEFLKSHRRVSQYDSENLMYSLIQDTLKEMGRSELRVICHQPLNMLIRDPELLNDEECRYAMNSATHLDFLIYNQITKKPVLAIEVDGFHFHKNGTIQAERDKKKNHILELYGIPYLRFATNGSGEKELLIQKLSTL